MHIKTSFDENAISLLAHEIWLEHFSPLLGIERVKSILSEIQSPEAIRDQIRSGMEYFTLIEHNEPIGYLAFRPDPANAELFLSKLYIKREWRGRGFAREAISFLERRSALCGITRITLTVYPGNSSAIAAYERMGFVQTGTVYREIGDFKVHDIFMQKTLRGESEHPG